MQNLHTLFEESLRQCGVNPASDTVLAAVSGGVDSMVLLHLLHQTGCKTAIAHVSFGLRPAENAQELELIRKTAEKLDIPFHLLQAETLAVAKENDLSVQMAARKIRYDFFEKISASFGYRFIATAHHAGDNLENLFIYLCRNKGMEAFAGIPAVNGHTIRPLLPFRKQEIEAWAVENNIPFLTDSSNFSDKYLRNRIRHHIIPGLLNFFPDADLEFYQIAGDFAQFLKKYQIDSERALEAISSAPGINEIFIPEKVLKNTQALYAFKNRLRSLGVHPHQFHQILSGSHTGATFQSPGLLIFRERDGWLLSTKREEIAVVEIQNQDKLPAQIQFGNFQIRFANSGQLPASFAADTWYFDMEQLQFPLLFRSPKTGDRMSLFGMKGSKKISDIFTDAHVPNYRKNEIPVLEDKNGILGLVSLRRSAAAALHSTSRKILEVNWSEWDAGNETDALHLYQTI